MLKNHKCIVFAIDHYNPLGIVRSLGRYGIIPDIIAIKGKARLMASSRYAGTVHEAESVAEGYDILLKQYGNVKNGMLPIIFCSDDRTIGYMDERYDELKDRFILFNAGRQGRINEYMDKYKILKCAERSGLKTLKGVICNHGEVPKKVNYPIITKAISPNAGAWKADVHICHTEEELRAAYAHIQADRVLIQKYIEKKNEYCIEGFSINSGRQTCYTIASTYNYLLPGYYSPYMSVKNMSNKYVKKGLDRMFAEIGFEGIFEVEFLIDKNDELYFSEINFRNSTWSWASTMAGMNLPALWGEAMLSGKIPDDACKPIKEALKGMVEPIDFGKRVEAGMITFGEWLKDFKEAQVTYYYEKDDLGPYYLMMKDWKRLS